MMKRITLTVVVTAMLAFGMPAGAQSKTFDGVMKITLEKVGPIYQNKQVKGYYMFYMFDKVDKHTNDYLLRILDENLNPLGEKHIEGSKEMYVEDGGYDNNNIMLKLVDPKEYTMQFLTYDETGKQISSSSLTMDKKEFNRYNQTVASGLFTAPFNTIPDVGFVNFGIKKEDDYGYTMDFYSQQMPKKNWHFENPDDGGLNEYPCMLAGDKDRIVSYTIKTKGRMSKKVQLYLQAHDPASGKRKFETSLNDGTNIVWPLNAFLDGENILLSGLLFDDDDKILKATPQGLAFLMMNDKGKVLSKKTVLWDDISAKVKNVADVKKISNIYFHSVTKVGNGNYVFAGETFHRAADGLGIALSILNRGDAGVTKIVIDDLLMLEFKPDLKLARAELIKKGNSNFSLGAGTDFYGMALLGHLAKMFGAFDYVNTQFDPANPNKLYVNYTDYDRINEGEKKTLYCGSVIYNDGKYTVDKVPLNYKKGSSTTRLLPAKDGFITIMSYIKKDKTLSFDLVKLKN